MVKTFHKSWFSNFSKLAVQHRVRVVQYTRDQPKKCFQWILDIRGHTGIVSVLLITNLGRVKSQFPEEKYLFFQWKEIIMYLYWSPIWTDGIQDATRQVQRHLMEDRLHICEAYETDDMAHCSTHWNASCVSNTGLIAYSSYSVLYIFFKINWILSYKVPSCFWQSGLLSLQWGQPRKMR